MPIGVVDYSFFYFCVLKVQMYDYTGTIIKQAKLDGENGHCFCVCINLSRQEPCIQILLEAQQLSEFIADSLLIPVNSFLRQLFTENRSGNIQIIYTSRIFNDWIRNSGSITTGQYSDCLTRSGTAIITVLGGEKYSS